MIQNHVLGGNKNGCEFLHQQNDSNSSRNPEVNANPPQSTHAVARTTCRKSIFHKTRPCYSFLEGKCHKDDCNYAHSSKELRQRPPPNWQELVKDTEITIGRVGICWKNYNGEECPYGERCGFLHEGPVTKLEDETDNDQESPRESTVVTIQTVPDDVRGDICDKWKTTGQCNLADTRHFSDGLVKDTERIGRSVGICWKFFNGEECPFGETCKFLHEKYPQKLQHTDMQTLVRCLVSEGQARPPNFVHENPTKLRGETANEMRRKRSESTVTKIPTVVSQQQRGFAKLANKKLNGIYGDWINEEEDDQVL